MSIDMRGIYLPEFGLTIEVSSVNGGRWHLVGACDISGSVFEDPASKPPGALPLRAYMRASSTSAVPRGARTPKKKQPGRKAPRKGTRRAA